jgi:hypothetical protein
MPALLTRWDPVDGLRIHALERTDLAPPGRTPVVLAHGAAVSSRHMERAAEALAASFRVYVPDYPGHGRSQNPPRVLDAAGLGDFGCPRGRTREVAAQIRIPSCGRRGPDRARIEVARLDRERGEQVVERVQLCPRRLGLDQDDEAPAGERDRPSLRGPRARTAPCSMLPRQPSGSVTVTP